MLLLPLKDFLYFKCTCESAANSRRQAAGLSPRQVSAETLVRVAQRAASHVHSAPGGPRQKQLGRRARPGPGADHLQSQVGLCVTASYVWRKHGLRAGFYRGLVSSLVLNFWYRGLSIGFYDTYKNANRGHSSLLKVVCYSAYIVGITLIFHPLDTARRTYMNENNYRETKVVPAALTADQLVRAGHEDNLLGARSAGHLQGVLDRVHPGVLVFPGPAGE